MVGNYWRTGHGSTDDVYCPFDEQLGHRRDFYEPGVTFPSRCSIGAYEFNWLN